MYLRRRSGERRTDHAVRPAERLVTLPHSLGLVTIGGWGGVPPLELTVIHGYEQGKPKNRKRIDWKLITDLPVQSF
jgi:hypothetical protein